MTHRVLLIGRWIVDFLFAPDGYDIEGILSCMYDIDAPYQEMLEAKRLMENCGANCGFTYANADLRRAVVVIGPVSSSSEFIDTLVHEIHHLAVSIASGLGIDLESESPAYIAGDAARSLAEVICSLGCPCCGQA